jgi:hypothetical protein
MAKNPLDDEQFEAKPFASSREEALRMPGKIYEHYKGGIYRVFAEGRDSEHLREVVIYEHLWPHAHQYWVRPKDEFYGTLANGTPRFLLIKES